MRNSTNIRTLTGARNRKNAFGTIQQNHPSRIFSNDPQNMKVCVNTAKIENRGRYGQWRLFYPPIFAIFSSSSRFLSAGRLSTLSRPILYISFHSLWSKEQNQTLGQGHMYSQSLLHHVLSTHFKQFIADFFFISIFSGKKTLKRQAHI